ncbi:UMP kinase [Sedimenticola selenatireducens]|uniref:Uridylate kinase n=1 Tax=Sedimenticola selenatireducens TaxID=191960 RepID=A0A558DVA3_9GAMM|nr:UMP kinase [Sedimenticola selenatireducens]TVO77665.1 UMP kinase [Sedimenticola selenatireducens]TVT64971.1 MAG: UMP kinase [Sedimenticola selenatireducens]
MSEAIYRRILLKLSGEALMGEGSFGIDPDVIARVAGDIKELVASGIQIGLVIGGGNIFRGEGLAKAGIDRVSGDHMGMLATVMNALAMQDALVKIGVPARTMSAIPMEQVCDTYVRRQAVEHLDRGEVVLFAAGTGNPFFTTDSAASLRAIEINADLMIKATKVDGVYSADPVKEPSAVFYPRISYDRALADGLKVMDATAIVLCRDNEMPLRIMNINTPGALMRLVKGEAIGSLVESGK